MRTALIALTALAVTAALVVGLVQAKDDGAAPATSAPRFDLAAGLRELRGSPPPLAALHRKASELVPATPASFERRLAALKGHGVVVNKWASWCAPCRAEFPLLQRVAVEYGRDVAFVGLNASDGTKPAARFLAQYPLPYPSFEDPDEEIARDISAPANYPITVFYDPRGRQSFIKQGAYRDEADLRADVERYAR